MANGVGSAALSGGLQGANTGAKIGSLIPGVGTAGGAALGAGIGAISSGLRQKKANEAQEIPAVDPLERSRLAQLEQTRRSISSGSDALTQQAIEQQKRIGAAAQSTIARNTAGDVGGTLDALLKAQKATQGGVNTALAQAANRIPYLDTASGQMASKIADRRLQLGLLNRAQKVAENAQARTDANLTAQALLATEGGTQTIPEGIQQAGQQIQGFFQNRRQQNQQQNQMLPPPQNQMLPPPNVQPPAQNIQVSPEFIPMGASGLGGVQTASFLGEGDIQGVPSYLTGF